MHTRKVTLFGVSHFLAFLEKHKEKAVKKQHINRREHTPRKKVSAAEKTLVI